MWGVGEVLRKVVIEYRGEKRELVVGVDNKSVVERMKKGRGLCREGEQLARKMGLKLMERGWRV